MQSSDFEPDIYKKWFRRPTIFVAVAWMLLCAAGKIVLTKVAVPLSTFFSVLGLYVPRRALTVGLDLVYKLGILALPVIVYAGKHDGVSQSMRVKRPMVMTMVYGLIFGAALVPLSRTLTILWSLALQMAGAQFSYVVRAPNDIMTLIRRLIIDAMIGGVCEELMLRGGLMGAWERRGSERALIVSTLMSALLAGSIKEFPSFLAVYLTFGLLAVMGDSLWPAIAAHVAYSALMIVFDYVNGSYVVENIYETVVTQGHLMEYALSLGWSVGLWIILLIVYRSMCRYSGRFRGLRTNEAPEEMDAAETLILFIAFITVALIVGEDFVSIVSFG